MAEDNRFIINIITPDREFYNGEATFIEFNTTEGEVGIYKNHIPMTMILKPGILHIYNGEDEKIAALHAGFVEVLQEKITILAEIVEWPQEIDLERAEAARDRAQERLQAKAPETDMARAEIALKRAMARISAIK